MRSKVPMPNVTNALQIGTDSEGGYLVPDEYERTLVEAFLLRMLCTLYWWNPGVHVCRLVIMRLCDHRCDGEPLRSASPSSKFFCTNIIKKAVACEKQSHCLTISIGFYFPMKQDSLPAAQSPKDV